MPDLDLEDISNRPPSLVDVREARAAAGKMIVLAMMKLPPELAIQVPNIHRCLGMLEDLLVAHEARKVK